MMSIAHDALDGSFADRDGDDKRAAARMEIEIALKHDSKSEAATREQLQRLLKTYDVTKWARAFRESRPRTSTVHFAINPALTGRG